ncbi:unnamed protein product [Rotaria sp. Silwood2]|nr:unnamed protein product [Rotaria sp. Silwood2]
MDIHPNNGNFDDRNIHKVELYFDLTNKIDLKNDLQPVPISSTINLNSLATVRNLQHLFYTSLLSLLAYGTSILECAFGIVIVLSTLANLSDIARVNELYLPVVIKVI